MGKTKSKKQKQAPEPAPVIPTEYPEPDSSDPVKAIDGHNTQGWTDSEIKAYNELLVERQKLEKQRHELEEKCAKSQTQRALLHENVANIDSMFKQQKTMPSAFRFTGSSTCCVELDTTASCHHEICKRAKSRGVSDVELDTIKYYSMRIHTEKSDRIRSALRKQRDLELIRIKREEEEGQALTAKKSSKQGKSSYGELPKAGSRSTRSKDMTKAAKETEKIVNKIINQLDDLRSDLQTGKISAEEAQGKLNILDSKLPLMQDKNIGKTKTDGSSSSNTKREITPASESFQSHLRERLLNGKGDTFSQAFSIMDHFLSATKPDDLQEAISELKSVLQLTGPMCDELQNSLGALEGIFDNPEKLSFTGPDGKQECNSIIDLMEKLKETLKRTGQLPDGANASLTKVFQECIDLESEAKEQLTLKCNDGVTTSAALPSALRQVKDEFVAKSPIPPLTSNKLDIDIANLLDVYDARQLLVKARSGAKATELEAQITSLVITRTQKNSSKYIQKLRRLELACQSAGNQDGSEMLGESIQNVLGKMMKWIPASETKKQEQSLVTNKPNGVQSAERQHPQSGASTGRVADTTSSVPVPSVEVSSSTQKEVMEGAQKNIRTAIEQHGVWSTFNLYCQKTLFATDTAMRDKAESYKEKTRALMQDEAYGIPGAISYLHKLKLCPGLVAVLISQVLYELVVHSEDDALEGMKKLSSCMQSLPPSLPLDWSATFQHIALAMTKLYVATYVETLATFPTISSLHLAISTMATVTMFVLLNRSSSTSENNLRIIKDFLTIGFGGFVLQPIPSFEDAFAHYEQFCLSNKYKCMTTGPCTKHMEFVRMPFIPQVIATKKSLNKQKMLEANVKEPSMANKVAPTADHSIQPTTIPEMKTFNRSNKITPMKTRVRYQPDLQAEQRAQQAFRKKDVRVTESLKQAAILYESTVRRSSALLQLRTDDSSIPKTVPSREVLSAMDDIFNTTYSDVDHVVNDAGAIELDSIPNNSKFLEHLDERPNSTRLAIRSALNIQNVFKQLKHGTLGAEYLNVVRNSIQERAMSGRYSNPIEAVTGFARSLSKIGKVPNALADSLVQTQNNIQSILEDPDEWLACETRRLKHLLAMVNADKPTVNAIFQLALKSPSAFHEYQEIMFDKLEETKTAEVELLEEAESDISQLAKTLKLKVDSPSLLDFVRLAVEDWRQRPTAITNFTLGSDEEDYFSYEEDNVSDVGSQDSGALQDATPMITESPAKQPIVEQRSSMASAVASHASIAFSANNHVAIRSPGDTSRLSTEDGSADQQTECRDTNEKVDSSHANLDRRKMGTSVDVDNEVAQSVSVEGNSQRDLHDIEPQYLLPDTEDHTAGHNQINDATPSTPTSFRMLDMMKHLRALQGNSRDLFQTAKEVSQFNKEHGTMIRDLADKVASQVSQYTAFAQQIAEWNGVELVQDASTHKKFSKDNHIAGKNRK